MFQLHRPLTDEFLIAQYGRAARLRRAAADHRLIERAKQTPTRR